MRSPTQPSLTADDVAALVRTALGPDAGVTAAAELPGGGFAAVWGVDLHDGRRCVLKVGPPPGVRLLRYECDLIAAEVDYFRLVRDRLTSVPVPEVLHFDLWDGNVLASPTPGGAARLCGLVDGERYLYGDPLVDLVSAALFRRIEDEPRHPFLLGYAAAAGLPLPLDSSARTRLALYRAHLYLLMLVEGPSRGLVGAAARDGWLGELFTAELAYLTA